MNPSNNNINSLPDPGLKSVNNFHRLMQLFPKEHPSSIHGIMVMSNNDLEKAMDMLLYVTQYRKYKKEKATMTCQNCSNDTEGDVQILNRTLRNISDRSDEEIEIEDDSDSQDVPEDIPKKKIKLEKFPEVPKAREKGKVPAPTTLKRVYKDKNSQFVKIVKLA